MTAILCVTSTVLSLVLDCGLGEFVQLLLWVVVIDFGAVGAIVATALWLLCNGCLLKPETRRDEDVEWAYCWDVHVNAFLPLVVLLHFVMPTLYLLIIQHDYWISTLVGNTLFLVAIGYYIYITFLGYAAQKNLRSTHIFLYPFTFLFIFYVATLTIGWNMSRTLMHFYKVRVA